MHRLSDDEVLSTDSELVRGMAARRAALKEYASDAAAVYLIGLPALLATAQLAASRHLRQSREAEGGTYPTWGNRMFFMLEAADEAGWLDALRSVASYDRRTKFAAKAISAHIGAIRAWVGSTPQWHVTDRWIAQGHRAAEALLPSVRTFIASRFASCVAAPSETVAGLPVLLDRLSRSLPPDNLTQSDLTFKPAKLEQIFLASWAHRLLVNVPTFDQSDLSLRTRDTAERLRRLTFKAIENVDFHHQFYALLHETEVASGSADQTGAREAPERKTSKTTRHNASSHRKANR